MSGKNFPMLCGIELILDETDTIGGMCTYFLRVGVVPTLTKEIHGMCIFLTSEEAENWAPNQLHKTSQKDYDQFKISIITTKTNEENHFNFQIFSFCFYVRCFNAKIR